MWFGIERAWKGWRMVGDNDASGAPRNHKSVDSMGQCIPATAMNRILYEEYMIP